MRHLGNWRAAFFFPSTLALVVWPGAVLAPGGGENARTAWFEQARFGMFIHWGIYSVLGRGEWVMHQEKIPVAEYEKLGFQFNPTEYNPREWAALAREAGMKYITVTTKHHDGFCMFASELTDYDCLSTPAKRDFIGELVEACRAEGLRIMFYYSLLDWHHPHYVPKPKWVEDPPGHQRDFSRYLDYMFGQIRELCLKYKPDGIWFDGGWEHSAEEWRSEELMRMIRELLPNAIVNNRSRLPGDFDTPEQRIPAAPVRRGQERRLWETCMTINNHWGYAAADHNHKSVRQLIHNLVDIVSKGGNYLLNVGPMPNGKIQPEFVVRLRQMGAWLKVNGESIYGTQPSPFRTLPGGGCTVKGNRLYLHVFDWLTEPLVLEGLQNRVKAAYLLRDRTPIEVRQEGTRLTILPAALVPDPYDTVIAVEVEGTPKVDLAIRPAADGSIDLPARFAEVHGQTARYEFGPERDNIGFWTDPSDWVSWDFLVTQAGTYRVEITYACGPGQEGSEYALVVGEQQLTGKVKNTGGWGKFVTETLGELTLAEGRYTLAVKPLTKPHGAVMNLQGVRLRR